MSLPATHLDLSVFDGEEDEEGQHADDDGRQDQDGDAHRPVEGQQAGPAVLTGAAALGTGQALEHVRLVIPRRQALRRGQRKVSAGSSPGHPKIGAKSSQDQHNVTTESPQCQHKADMRSS